MNQQPRKRISLDIPPEPPPIFREPASERMMEPLLNKLARQQVETDPKKKKRVREVLDIILNRARWF